MNLSDTQRQILLTLSDGHWHELGQVFHVNAIAVAIRYKRVRQDHPGTGILGSLFTITPEGEAAIGGDA